MNLNSKLNRYRQTKVGEYLAARLGFGYQLQKKLNTAKPKIGFALLAWERPEYLEVALDTLFQTNLHDYDVTFLLQDDGSKDPKVAELINRPRGENYKIERWLSPRGPGNAGAAINKAMKKLMELGDFDIIGWADPDALFHPEWLDNTVKLMTWAKANHREHVLGPFSTFNSSDYKFHQVLGMYSSPFGNYVVKRQMGMLNYLYFKEDFLKLGYFPEVKEDETLMTQKFEQLRVRNFCSEVSYLEHIGRHSSLVDLGHRPADQSVNDVHGINLIKEGWGIDIQKYLDLPQQVYKFHDWEFSRAALDATLGVERNLFIIAWRLFRKGISFITRSWHKFSDYYRYLHFWNKALLTMKMIVPATQLRLGLSVLRKSSEPIEVVIPMIEKDLNVIPHTVASLRKNLRHPITAIKIVAPDSEGIKKFCAENNCEFVNENSVLPITKNDIDYKPRGQDRRGWILQQLLKLGMSKFVNTDNYLVWDADTLLLRPQAFVKDGVYEFDVSDEAHKPYFKAHAKLLQQKPSSPLSFIAHHIIVNKELWNEIVAKIEEIHGMPWWQAYIASADHNDLSGIADYETYGHYVFGKYQDKVKIAYWHNYSARRDKLPKLVSGWRRWFLARRYKTLSFQHYNT